MLISPGDHQSWACCLGLSAFNQLHLKNSQCLQRSALTVVSCGLYSTADLRVTILSTEIKMKTGK